MTGDRREGGPTDPELCYHLDPNEPPSHAVVAVLAILRDCDPAEMPPVGERLDLDALDDLLAGTDSRCTVAVDVLGYEVVLHGDEAVEVRDSESSGS